MKALVLPSLILFTGLAAPAASRAFVISLDGSDFTVAPQFSGVTEFSISIDIAGPLLPGIYANPPLNGVVYNIGGPLSAGTPSGFSSFDLRRTIGGAEYYAQGSSLNFEIAATANLLDGLQLSELAGADPVFVFNAREVNTGRYHPTLLQLAGDGTGSVRNSNNMGGVNPGTMQVVNVDFGQEYISNLSANPAALTLAAPVPEHSAAAFLAFGTLALGRRRRPIS